MYLVDLFCLQHNQQKDWRKGGGRGKATKHLRNLYWKRIEGINKGGYVRDLSVNKYLTPLLC